jgi:hypothetical protein
MAAEGAEAGLTDEEMVERVHSWSRHTATAAASKLPSPSGLRTARKALQRAGLVEPNGSRRPTTLGNEADVFVLTDAGRRFTIPA